MAPPPALGGIGGYNPNVPYAGFWIRFGALIIDSIIVAVAVFVVSLVAGILIGVLFGLLGQGSISSAQGPLTILSYLITILVSVGYFVYGWGMGSTRGMRFFRIAVVDADTGQPIGFGRAGFRYVGYVLSCLPCYLGLIWAAFDPRKQGWHDKIAHSVVVQG